MKDKDMANCWDSNFFLSSTHHCDALVLMCKNKVQSYSQIVKNDFFLYIKKKRPVVFDVGRKKIRKDW